jgi:putative phosphoesterase
MGLFGKRRSRTVVGVISDTHGPLTEEAAEALVGVDHIICAGDLMSPEVLPALQRIARRVTAVRGNMDGREPTRSLPWTAVAEVGGAALYVLHDLADLDLDPRAAGFAAVIHGHTHRAEIEWRDNVLYLNPGSAGAPRSLRPATIAKILVEGETLVPEILELP